MLTIRRIVYRSLLVGAGIVAACQTTNTGTDTVDTAAAESACFEQTPLPNPVPISPPSADVPEEISQFSGIWSNGKWDGKLCATLVVASVDAAGNVEAIYSHGAFAGWDILNADYFKSKGKVADGKLILEKFRNGAVVTYWFSGEKLKGSYFRNGGTSNVTLSRITQ
jgi:hypothetical protein